MTTVLQACTIEEQHSVVRFLWSIGLNENDINKDIFSVYGEKFLSRKAVRNWAEKFSREGSKVADDARLGRPVKTATEATVQRTRVDLS
jgi:transposase